MFEHLQALPDDALVCFGDGQISFSRLVELGEADSHRRFQIEFNEIYSVTPDPTGG